MRVLVTGATGFLGNNLVRMLLVDGHEVVTAIRVSSDMRPLDGLTVETISPDLNSTADVGHALENIDLVINCLGFIHFGRLKLEESRRVNVEMTRNLAVAARRKKIRMIHVSSVDALAPGQVDRPADENNLEPAKFPSAYVVSKREAEQAFLEEVKLGLDGVIINPGFMVGPYDWKPSSGRMMLMLWKQPVLFFTLGGGCSVVDVRDVADGIISAVKRGRTGERYILGGENMTYLELWKLMAKVMGKRPPRVPMPDWFAKTVGKVGDLISFLFRREIEVNSATMTQGQQYHWYSSDKARRELDYRITNVEDALCDAWEWFNTNGYA